MHQDLALEDFVNLQQFLLVKHHGMIAVEHMAIISWVLKPKFSPSVSGFKPIVASRQEPVRVKHNALIGSKHPA